VYSSEFDGISFIEGHPLEARILDHVEITIQGIFSQAQLKSLDDVKKILAGKVKSKNGNSLVNFKYGQRSSFWSTIVGIDDVSWYGSGDVAVIPAPPKG
jgi:hypothetical protein